MADMIVLGMVAVCVGIAIRYIVKAKKKGVNCIGCSFGRSCSGCCNSCSRSDSKDEKNEKNF